MNLQQNFIYNNKRGDFQIPEDDLAAEFYEVTQSMMETQQRPAYEISNHAAKGKECQHNLIYWRYQDYIGIGPGAHGRISKNGQKIAIQNIKSPELWAISIEQHMHGQKQSHILSQQDMFEEKLMMGLRLKEGINIKDFHSYLDTENIEKLVEYQYLDQKNTCLIATEKGRLCLNAILPYMIR